MKKFMKKHLKESNEGFSLVELIIVIAIMAILIGVVALQVIPYMEKSRESKDLTQIAAAYRAFETAVTEQQISGAIAPTKYVGSTTPPAAGATDADKIQYTMQQNLGLTGAELKAKLVSANCSPATAEIYFEKDATTDALKVYVGASGNPVKGKYNNAPFEVTSKK